MTDSREYPSRPIVGVGALVFKEDAVLLIQRGKPPRLGEWTLPGGAIELGETIEQAAEREILEECNIRIANCELLETVDVIIRDNGNGVQYHFVIVDLTADYAGGDLRAASDALSARWITESESNAFELRAEVRRVIEKAFARRTRAPTLRGS